MTTISAAVVKELRDKTGAGMMDCKRALVEANGDMSDAIDNLRKSGIAKAEKKTGRTTKEGLIVASTDSSKLGVLTEILCETDFASKSPAFQEFTAEVLQRIIETTGNGDITEQVADAEKDNLTDKIAIIGENMQIRRTVRWETEGTVASYLHMGGRIGVLVDVDGDVDDAFLSDLCMHIAAFNPPYISSDEIPAEDIEKEREIAKAQLVGKPENIIEKILTGKINKWFSEVCLMNQPWIKDDKSSLSKIKPGVTVKRFVRWEIGEEL